jgi:hypothetical protein
VATTHEFITDTTCGKDSKLCNMKTALRTEEAELKGKGF